MHALHASLAALLLLIADGGWLGVYLAPDREEAVVVEVVPDSPADKAGLRAGDVIVGVDGVETRRRDELIDRIGRTDPGDRVELALLRDGKKTRLVVRVGRRPDEVSIDETVEPAPARRRTGRPGRPDGESGGRRAEPQENRGRDVFLGIRIAEEDGEVIIDEVLDDSPAMACGLRDGDRLIRLDGHRIGSFADLDEALGGLRSGRRVEVQVENDRMLRSVMITPRASKAPRVVLRRSVRTVAPQGVVEEIVEEIAREEIVEEVAREEVVEEIVREEIVEEIVREEIVEEIVREEIVEEIGREEVVEEEIATEIIEEVLFEEAEIRGAERRRGGSELAAIEREIEELRAELRALKRRLVELREQLGRR